MRPYLALTWMAIQRTFAYRTAVIAGLLTNFFFALLRAAVITALFASNPHAVDMSLPQAITYVGLTQAAIGYLTLFGWFEIVFSVHNGQVGADLLKPMSYYGFWMAQDLGRALVNLLLRGLPMMLYFELFYDLTYPSSGGQWVALVISMLLAWQVSFAFRFLVNLAAFWVPNAVGVCRLFYALSWFLSGFIMPLRFLPDWFVELCYWTPFPHIINTPVEVYLGLLPPAAVTQALLLQAGWALALVLAGHLVLGLGVRRLVIQGG